MRDCSRRRPRPERVGAGAASEKNGSKATYTRITWADAEVLCPGIEAEWRSMLGTRQFTEHSLDGRTVRLPVPTPPSGSEWRLEVIHGFGDQPWVICVVQLDHEGRWHSPPQWRRWPGGGWSSPMAVPKGLLFYMDYRYDFTGKADTGNLLFGPLGFTVKEPTRRVVYTRVSGSDG